MALHEMFHHYINLLLHAILPRTDNELSATEVGSLKDDLGLLVQSELDFEIDILWQHKEDSE
jgi:hypothetical protein